MVRTKQFDKHAALDQAMELFWERGYHATSIQDLVDTLGVNRQSLYDTYGGKDALFLAALERYREMQAVPMRRSLERDAPAKEVLREFFGGFIDNALAPGFKGCFMANTITELAVHDEAVAAVCEANSRHLEAAFAGLLVRAQQSGELAADRPVMPLARFLVNTMQGLAVTAKVVRDRKALEGIVEVALGALGA
jgi:TetR/AcrR family transcriptional regulator, transcriptional repressor for nem operon